MISLAGPANDQLSLRPPKPEAVAIAKPAKAELLDALTKESATLPLVLPKIAAMREMIGRMRRNPTVLDQCDELALILDEIENQKDAGPGAFFFAVHSFQSRAIELCVYIREYEKQVSLEGNALVLSTGYAFLGEKSPVKAASPKPARNPSDPIDPFDDDQPVTIKRDAFAAPAVSVQAPKIKAGAFA